MDWTSLLIAAPTALIAAALAYFFGAAKDRSSALHAKKIEAMTRLHDRVLQIEKTSYSMRGECTL